MTSEPHQPLNKFYGLIQLPDSFLITNSIAELCFTAYSITELLFRRHIQSPDSFIEQNQVQNSFLKITRTRVPRPLRVQLLVRVIRVCPENSNCSVYTLLRSLAGLRLTGHPQNTQRHLKDALWDLKSKLVVRHGLAVPFATSCTLPQQRLRPQPQA